MKMTVGKWLDNEDKQCRDDRIKRLKWTKKKYPRIEISLFYGGLKSRYLFEEARYCFVYGQYIASTLLSLSYIENELASFLYASGENDIKGKRVVDLLKAARENKLISQSEFDVLDKVRKIRNPLTHFRKPVDKDTIEYRSVMNYRHPYEIIEEDAKIALRANFRIMTKFAVATP